MTEQEFKDFLNLKNDFPITNAYIVSPEFHAFVTEEVDETLSNWFYGLVYALQFCSQVIDLKTTVLNLFSQSDLGPYWSRSRLLSSAIQITLEKTILPKVTFAITTSIQQVHHHWTNFQRIRWRRWYSTNLSVVEIAESSLQSHAFTQMTVRIHLAVDQKRIVGKNKLGTVLNSLSFENRFLIFLGLFSNFIGKRDKLTQVSGRNGSQPMRTPWSRILFLPIKSSTSAPRILPKWGAEWLFLEVF